MKFLKISKVNWAFWSFSRKHFCVYYPLSSLPSFCSISKNLINSIPFSLWKTKCSTFFRNMVSIACVLLLSHSLLSQLLCFSIQYFSAPIERLNFQYLAIEFFFNQVTVQRTLHNSLRIRFVILSVLFTYFTIDSYPGFFPCFSHPSLPNFHLHFFLDFKASDWGGS